MRIEIVENIRKRMKADNAYIKDAAKGRLAVSQAKAEKSIIMTPETFAKVLSPERIRIIIMIGKKNARNIYQLAKALGRRYEAVHRDIKLLEGFGIIIIKEKGRERVPVIEEQLKLPQFCAG